MKKGKKSLPPPRQEDAGSGETSSRNFSPPPSAAVASPLADGKGGRIFFDKTLGEEAEEEDSRGGKRKLKKVFRVFRGAPDGGEEEAPERRSVKQKETREERRKGKERSTCGAFKKAGKEGET